jgi:predicted DNA-binding transcriptional regulator YafY
MEEERVTLSAGEQRQVVVLNHLEKGAVTVEEAARLLGISKRQVQRLRAEYRRDGAGALASIVHQGSSRSAGGC